MANKASVEAVVALLRELLNDKKIFGGIPFIAVGDFRQVAPVTKENGPSAVFDSSIKSSALWRSFQPHSLLQPIRNANDPVFATWVDEIGEGTNDTGNIPLEFLATTTHFAAVESHLYPPHILQEPRDYLTRSFLSPLNVNVDDFNAQILSRLPSEPR